MSVETTYSRLRENLARELDRVVDDREVMIVRRRSGKDVALIAADELASILETLHLMSSPRNAQRLLEAIEEMDRSPLKRESLDNVKREFGLRK